MKSQFPIDMQLIKDALKSVPVKSLSGASIRENVAVIRYIESHTNIKILRMDMGIPGLPTPLYGTEAEIKAIKEGKAAIYGQIDGIPELKTEISRFIKLFLNVNVSSKSCIVTAGSMMGSMITFMVAAKREKSRQGVLFIDPGFPVQKKQAHVMNLPIFSFDIYNYRGALLHDKLEDIIARNGISLIVYSNPNNPTWICLTDEELKTIGEIANRHDIIVIEDLAYLGMDFRQNYGNPGQPPFQPSVARHTSNYILLISSSKVFNFAGQRVGMMAVSDTLFNRNFPHLLTIGENSQLGPALIMDGVYVISAGTGHTAQYGLTGILKAVNDGVFNYVEPLLEYKKRAKTLKNLFIQKGFKIVYDKDGDKPIADGFYFTVNYPGLNNEELSTRLLQYGIGTISLKITGSKNQNGVRICVSTIDNELLTEAHKRLNNFNK